jgi:hypothetical protein
VGTDASADLQQKYNNWVVGAGNVPVSADVLKVSGDLKEPVAWAIVGDFLGHHCKPDAQLNLSTVSIPADIAILTGIVPGTQSTWKQYWTALKTQQEAELTLDVTLEGKSSTAGGADALAKIFAGKESVGSIRLEKLTLKDGAALAIPPTLLVNTLVVGKGSAADFSGFDPSDFALFAMTGAEIVAGSDATFIVPDDTTDAELIDILETLFDGTGKAPAINVKTKKPADQGGREWSPKDVENLVRPRKSSGGCDAGFGLGGLLLLAGAVLTGRAKRG